MKYVPGHMFTVSQKPKMNFKLGETYKIYHIFPTKEGVEYVFQTSSGTLQLTFESTEHAEAIISKMSGK